MKSRIVRPVNRRGQNYKKKKKNSVSGDTQPMRPVGQNYRQSRISDTQPMEPVNPGGGYDTYRSAYRDAIDRRTSGGADSSAADRKKAGTTGKAEEEQSWSCDFGSQKQRTAQQEDYFDYDLLLVIVFLMCFGLVMLYSTSAYEADVDFGNDLYYFTRQALIAGVGFVVMFVVSKIDYHIYGAFAFEIYIFAMFMMALVQTPLGLEFNGARRWIQLPGNQTLQPAEITKIAVILFISYELCRPWKKKPIHWRES